MFPKPVLILAHYFLPANNAGGPPKSLANLIDTLAGRVSFRVVCCDHEYEVKDKLPGIQAASWTLHEGKDVFYQEDNVLSIMRTIGFCLSRKYGAIYLNSFFDPTYTILPLIASIALSKKDVYLSPRGEFSAAALAIKKSRKEKYIRLFRFFEFHKKIHWVATSEKERADIIGKFGNDISMSVIRNFPAPVVPEFLPASEKEAGSLKLVYLARIAPMKNTKYVFEVLSKVRSNIELHVYGPVEHEEYWAECRRLIEALPANISVDYKGGVAASNVISILKKYHAYILPTRGENFGHTIFEAASSGLPLIISDATPWKNLQEKEIGFDIPLADSEKFVQAIEWMAGLTLTQLNSMKKKAHDFAESYIFENDDVIAAERCFLR
jgi:glycosyltransferase involved in cell wall biosynthesis